MNKLKSKNWMRVRINRGSKVITFTNDITYKTKLECEKDIKSSQYIAVNLKAFNELLKSGYTNTPETKEVTAEAQNKALNVENEVVEVINHTVEAQIEAYAKMKADRDRNKDAIRSFLTPVKQAEVVPFDMTERLQKYEKTGRKRAVKALEMQRESYCGI